MSSPTSQTSGHSPLSATTPLPIAQLDPSLPSLSSKSIRAIVTLIWPYSSSKRSISLLVAEPDFRLRRNRGQVRIHFHGSAAKAVARQGVGNGDAVSLGLEGAEWLPVGVVSTPGKGIDWELSFAERLLMELHRDAQPNVVLNVDHPTPSPEPEAQAASPPQSPPPPPPSIGSQHLPEPKQAPMNEWSSPAFLKRARLSSGSLFGSSYDPFADADGFIEGKGRKRTRFWRESGQWRYTDRTPSPEKEILGSPPEEAGDSMDMDEDVVTAASGLSAHKPLAEEQGTEISVQENHEEIITAKELGIALENEMRSTESSMEGFAQTDASAASNQQEGLQAQEPYLDLDAVFDTAGPIPSSLESDGAALPSRLTSYPALPESPGSHAAPHMQRSSVMPLQTEADEYGPSSGSQKAPLSPRLRPVPSPSLPAVSPFDSSFTETIGYLDPIPARMQPDFEATSEHDKTVSSELNFKGDVEKESLYPFAPHDASLLADSNVGERLEMSTDEIEAAEVQSTGLAFIVPSTVLVQDEGSGGEREDIDNESESETDEFEDDEREELYSSIIPRQKQLVAANTVDGHELQPETYEGIQNDLRFSSPPRIDQNDGVKPNSGSEGSEDSEDSDDQQSLSQEGQISDEEADEESGSGDEPSAGGLADEIDSEQGEFEGDEEELYSSSSSPISQKRATTQEVEVIDLVSDDDDEPQREVQPEMIVRQSMRFGSDGATMSRFISEPKADSPAEQWGKVLASRNELRGEQRNVEGSEEYEQTLIIGRGDEVYEGGIRADGNNIPQTQVELEEDVNFRGQVEMYEIEHREIDEGGGLAEGQEDRITSRKLESRPHVTYQIEILREEASESQHPVGADDTIEVQTVEKSVVGIPPMADSRSDMDGDKQPSTKDNESGGNAGPRADAILGRGELPPSHEAEEYGTLDGKDEPRRLWRRPPKATDYDLVDAQLQSESFRHSQQEPSHEGDFEAADEIRYPTLPVTEGGRCSPPPSFIAESNSQIPKPFFGKPGLQLLTPEATQQTLASQLSVSSAHQDGRPTLTATQQDSQVSPPSATQSQVHSAPTASQEISWSPAPPLSQEQTSFSLPESPLENTSSELSTLPTQDAQTIPLTPQPTRVTPEPPVTLSSSQVSLLQRLREIKSASGKKQRGRDAVPDVISPWFTIKEVDQPEIDTEGGHLRGHEISADARRGSAKEMQHSSDSPRASPPPQNGLAVSHSPMATSPTVDATGVTTPLSFFSLLSTLQVLFSNIVDVLAIVTRHQHIKRAKHGSRDYVLSLGISDPSISTSVTVTILRPFKLALPIVSSGDGVLLRGFKVTSQKGKFLLQSTDVSSWAVFKSNGEVQVRGPPVEYGEGEAEQIETLKRWWRGLGVQAGKEVVARTSDEYCDALDG
ncbi:hypothetical protein FGG08_003781 [Glutinoglossum americanum]|uniref:Telomeric single stranded DNA binding POT1/Cdc13 domain-containing protein n=1 Tax=Glutinoglossum americanum TaxID=1670608 RepID=A0A9P8ICM4_9PEZI|nr:hypothetical protein FGG08_003781 [Glutinoglossum americanum]